LSLYDVDVQIEVLRNTAKGFIIKYYKIETVSLGARLPIERLGYATNSFAKN
jgi:hypothetical protein